MSQDHDYQNKSSDASSSGGGGGDGGPTILLTRRRDKRRNLSGAAALLDLRNPLQVLELAVRFDESRQDEELLKEPLEKGKLHDHKQFVQALEFLERHTKPPSEQQQPQPPQQQSSTSTSLFPSTATATSSSENQNVGRESEDFLDVLLRIWGYPSLRDTADYPDHALTPIILSGLLSNAVRGHDSNAKMTSTTSTTDAVNELFMTCQTMRRAAIRRVRNRHRRHKIQRNILPAASFCFLLILYVQSIREMVYTMYILHFMDADASCNIFSPLYEEVCNLAEAHLWSTYQDYLLLESCRNTDECLIRKYGTGALALQATFSRQFVPIEDVLDETTATPRELFYLGQIPRSQSPLKNGNSSEHPFSHLGLSVAHQTIELGGYSQKFKEWRILDAGCGVGGALWYWMPKDTADFRYHGVTLSQAEVHFAREMVERHGLTHDKVFFEQRSYDEILPRNSYNMIVAFESLMFSPNLGNTIANLMTALMPGGIMLVADEFDLTMNSETQNAGANLRRAPSFASYVHYSTYLEMHGCKVNYFREYGLEYHFEGYHTWFHQESPWDWIFYPWLPGRKSRLFQLRKDQEALYRVFQKKKEDNLAARTTYSLLVCVKPDGE